MPLVLVQVADMGRSPLSAMWEDVMREIIPGHLYELRNLKDVGTTELAFYMDPKLHDGMSQNGPSTQEVLRVCIARVKALDTEKPHPFNAQIIRHLRHAIALHECRAILRSVEKGAVIEDLPVTPDGHIVDMKEP